MHKRTAHRWRLVMVMTAWVLLALGSFWLVQLVERDDGVQADGLKNEPDYIVDKFSFVRMTPQGRPSYIISGDKLTHRPVDDVSFIDQPVVRSLTTEHPPLTVTALTARVDNARNQIDLIGKVDLERPATPQAQYMSVKTEAMTVLPDDDVLKTDAMVRMVLGSSTIRGTGMLANNATMQVHMASKGQIVYPPQAAR